MTYTLETYFGDWKKNGSYLDNTMSILDYSRYVELLRQIHFITAGAVGFSDFKWNAMQQFNDNETNFFVVKNSNQIIDRLRGPEITPDGIYNFLNNNRSKIFNRQDIVNLPRVCGLIISNPPKEGLIR